MAVYTDISEDELSAFLGAYPVGGLLSYKGIAEGVENSNYLLHTTAGHFILTLYEKRVNPDDLPFFVGLMEHLAQGGVTCPQPVKRADGGAIGRLAGRPAAIVTFLEGMWPRRPNAGHCRAVGAALARMHLAGRDFALTRHNALGVDGWRPLFDMAAARVLHDHAFQQIVNVPHVEPQFPLLGSLNFNGVLEVSDSNVEQHDLGQWQVLRLGSQRRSGEPTRQDSDANNDVTHGNLLSERRQAPDWQQGLAVAIGGGQKCRVA